MQCQLIAVTSCNFEQLLQHLWIFEHRLLFVFEINMCVATISWVKKKRDRDIFAQQWSHISYRPNKRTLFIPPSCWCHHPALDVRTMCYFFLASVSLIPCQANVLHSYSAQQEISPSKATRCLLNQESVIGQVSVKTADVQCVLIY